MKSIHQLIRQSLFLALGIFLLSSCGMYRQNIMFRTKNETLKSIVEITQKNYIIQPGDFIDLSVYSNNGEIVIDPNFELRKDIGISANAGRLIEKPSYLVRPDGKIKLPMLGVIDIAGYSLVQADSVLSILYTEFYIEAFAITKLANRRAIVLGATGGQVIPLLNENMSVLEVIAMAGGVANDAKAHNIRLIRGDLSDPQVEVIDLSTISGMSKASLKVQPNDVIYIEPVRKVIIEGVRDVSPILTVLTSILTLAIILSRN